MKQKYQTPMMEFKCFRNSILTDSTTDLDFRQDGDDGVSFDVGKLF